MNRIVIAAGGTGGHIYPALAIADSLKKADPSVEIEFVGATGGMEERVIPQAGYRLHTVAIGRLNRNAALSERILTLVKLPFALLKCFWLAWRLRPRLALGVGGFASGPMLLATSVLKVPTFIWEPNAMPGMANRILSRFADEALVVFEEARNGLKGCRLRQVGMPVRESIESLSSSRPPKEDDDFHVFVFGGSQGSRAINHIVFDSFKNFQWPEGVKVLHQIGRTDFEVMCKKYESVEAPVDIVEFVTDMEKKYQWADLVICRSGAGTLAELAACGQPSLLIPLPTAADNHQQKNAEVFVREGAARMILQKDLTPEVLIAEVKRLKSSDGELAKMSEAAKKLHHPKAGDRIAEYLLGQTGPRG
jgi:UDP-N-acetylglucosamine--N-acetylmuramyl-(pentapeptide) pyrophosphoryl-undecaprenol N-acetylglucosamine transferase